MMSEQVTSPQYNVHHLSSCADRKKQANQEAQILL